MRMHFAMAGCLMVGFLAGCGTGNAQTGDIVPMGTPRIADWLMGPKPKMVTLLVPTFSDQSGDPTWAGSLRFGANTADDAHPASAIASGRFRCAHPDKPNHHCRLRFTTHAWFEDGERIRVTFTSTTGEGENRKTETTTAWFADSGQPKTYALTHAPCSRAMNVRFDWEPGVNRGTIQSKVYFSKIITDCVDEPGTNLEVTGELTNANGIRLVPNPGATPVAQ